MSHAHTEQSSHAPQAARIQGHSELNLEGKIAIITGGAGILGRQHCQAIREIGGTAISVDIDPGQYTDVHCDITSWEEVSRLSNKLPRVDIVINNAALNSPPLVSSRLEFCELEQWNKALNVGLTGAYIMSSVFGTRMQSGSIINISSDLGLIAPDQSIYPDRAVKPAHYSVVKHGIIGLTKYVATYWPHIRCNCLCPGGVDSNDGIKNEHLIPMKRRARIDEYKGAIQFLASDASSYMTGSVLTIDGGRTAW